MVVTNLATLVRHARTDAGLTQAELARRAGTSQPALARYETGATAPTVATLQRLLAACGQRLELQAVPASPERRVGAQFGPQMRQLRRRRRPLLDAARTHGVRRVRVFGSLARGEEAPDSDVDLLVELAPDRTLLDLAAFRREAQQLLQTPVDVATPDMLKERIRAEILAEALPL